VQYIKWILLVLLGMPAFFIFSFFLHEVGHALTAFYFDMTDISMYFWPGFNISFIMNGNDLFPNVTFESVNNRGANFMASTGFNPPKLPENQISNIANYIVFTDYNLPKLPYKLPENQDGYISLMGSGLNYLLSLASIIYLYLTKQRGILFILAVAGAFLFYDILSYTIFPIFFDLRHLIFWGGTAPEPILALTKLGINQNFSVTFIIIVSIIHMLYLYKIMSNYGKQGSRA